MNKKITTLIFLTAINITIFIMNIGFMVSCNPPSAQSPKIDTISVDKSYFKSSDGKIAPYCMIKMKIYHPTDYEPNKNDSIMLQSAINLDCSEVTHKWSYDSINNNRKAFRENISKKISNTLEKLIIPCDSMTYFFE